MAMYRVGKHTEAFIDEKNQKKDNKAKNTELNSGPNLVDSRLSVNVNFLSQKGSRWKIILCGEPYLAVCRPSRSGNRLPIAMDQK